MARKLVVEIVGDASKLDREFKKASNSANTFNRNIGAATRGGLAAGGAFKGLGRSLAFASGGFLTGAALTAGLKSAFDEASDLEQQISKTNVVFAESGKEVEAWSKTLTQSFGLSQREALATASSFGALFAPIGLAGDVAAEQSKKLTELGADLASFYNTDVASALDALRSGLVGESEPLRRYGVLLSETRVQQEALNQTHKKSAKSLTDQEKVLARISLIFKDSRQAQGDFGRTSDTAANQIKILQANIANLKAELGASFISVVNTAAAAINDLFEALAGTPVEGSIRGQGVERALVPALAKRIAALKAAGKSQKEIIELLRTQLGDAEKANDLIQEALRFNRDFRLAAEVLGKEVLPPGARGPILPEPEKTGEQLAAARKAREAFRQEVQERGQLAVERTRLTETVADDIAALERLNALLLRRIRGGHGTIQLEREQLSVQLQINDLLRQQAEARRQAREDAARAAKEARDTRQFRILGLGPGGQELVPGVNNLKKQLQSVTDAVRGSFLDTRKTRGVLARIRAVLKEGIGNVSKDVREEIARMLADIRQQLKGTDRDFTRFQKNARGQFVLAGAHPAGGGNVVIQGGVHLHGVQNVEQMEAALAKRRRQRARQRRSNR